MKDREQYLGLFNKYEVRWKADADPDIKLSLCDLFILDQCHDIYSFATLKEYMGDDLEMDLTQPYTVKRNNDPVGKHKDCDFFVLNLTTDVRARKAAKKYVELCRDRYPALAHELGERILRNSIGDGNGQETRLGWRGEIQQNRETSSEDPSESRPGTKTSK